MGAVRAVRITGVIEGLSWLLLLFVAMPLKYAFGYPEAVRAVGSAHGFLFVAFVLLLLRAFAERSWSIRRGALLFLAALVPFGFLFVDKTLRAEEAELSEAEVPA